MMKSALRITIFILFIRTLSYAQSPYKYAAPSQLNDGWETNDLRTLNIDTAGIYQLFGQVKNGENKLHSVLLMQNNQLLIEEYFNGHSAKKQHDLRSTTKSISSLLLGIAIDKGFIDNVNDPISKYLKSPVPTKNMDERKDEITIKHIITMSTGLECNDWDKRSAGQEDRVYKKKDWIHYTLNLPMVNDPGEVSNYCSMGVVLLKEIISRAADTSIDQFADEHLFKPLGIENISWGHTAEKKVIPAGKRLNMTSRDMAKIGQLILNKGSWHGTQIVSEKWIEEATTPKTQITGIDYGYLWWSIPFKVDEKVFLAKVATGNGGQYIMVFPELDMVAVFTGGAYNSQEDKLPFAIMTRILLPAFTKE